jgi:hypothetical protein
MPPTNQIRGVQIADDTLTAVDVVYSLDDAYDNGGSGLGRSINADSGPVVVDGSTSTALVVSGTLELYGPSATGPALRVVHGDIEINNSIKIEAGNGQNLQIYHDGANAAINNNTGHLLINSPLNYRTEIIVSGSTVNSQFRVRRNTGAVVDTLLQVQGDGSIVFGSGSLGASTFVHNIVAPRVQGKHMAATTQVVADAATINWDVDAGSVMQVTLGGNRTMAAPTNLVSGGTYVMIIKQGTPGNRTLTWNAVYKFEGGSKTLTTTANAVDVAWFVSDGVNLYGRLMKAVA